MKLTIKKGLNVFEIFEVINYACCFWDLKKLHPCKHKTARLTREYWHEGKGKLRKTG